MDHAQNPLRITLTNWLMRPTAIFSLRHIPQPPLSIIGSTRGRVRSDNQDKAVAASFYPERSNLSFRAYIVCDGLGGMSDGERCASEAIAAFLAHLVSTAALDDRRARLQRAVQFTNREIYNKFQERGGTTLAAVLLTESGATAISVGDTRIYKHRERGGITQLTVDDTVAARVAELNAATPNLQAGPLANQLTQFIGQRSEIVARLIEPNASHGNAQPSGDSNKFGLLITTDGVNQMGQQIFSKLAREAGSARELVHRLITVSDWIGGIDNSTAMYIVATEISNKQIDGRSQPPGLQIHDAHGELQIVSLVEPAPVVARPNTERPYGANQPVLAIPAVQDAPADKPKEQHPIAIGSKGTPKNKRKSKRNPGRKKAAGKDDEQPAQPELEMKVIQHSDESP